MLLLSLHQSDHCHLFHHSTRSLGRGGCLHLWARIKKWSTCLRSEVQKWSNISQIWPKCTVRLRVRPLLRGARSGPPSARLAATQSSLSSGSAYGLHVFFTCIYSPCIYTVFTCIYSPGFSGTRISPTGTSLRPTCEGRGAVKKSPPPKRKPETTTNSRSPLYMYERLYHGEWWGPGMCDTSAKEAGRADEKNTW